MYLIIIALAKSPPKGVRQRIELGGGGGGGVA